MKTFEELRYEAVKPVLTEVGAAIYASQRLENGIAYLLYLLSRAKAVELPTSYLERILNNQDKKTTGQLIALLRKHVTLPEHAEAILFLALERRNSVVHRYLTENSQRIMIPKGREEMIRELRTFRGQIHEASDYFHPVIKALALKVDGIDMEFGKSELIREFVNNNRHKA
jgi:hypothetical protein